MLHRKCEQKRYPSCVILALGALAAVGVYSMMRCGRSCFSSMKCKMDSMLSKAKSSIGDMMSGGCEE